jgi:hypothetical protein
MEKNNVDNNVFKVFNLDAAQLMYQNPKFFWCNWFGSIWDSYTFYR